MLDQNTDRMWFVIGALVVGAGIILLANNIMPEVFANVTKSFDEPRKAGSIALAEQFGKKIVEDYNTYSIKGSSHVTFSPHKNLPLKAGEKYTLIFDVKSETATYLESVFINMKISSLSPNIPISTEWKRVAVSFEWVEGGDYYGMQIRPHIYPRSDYSGTTSVRNVVLVDGDYD